MSFWELLKKHLEAEGIGGGLLIIGYLRTWPKRFPRKFQDWWRWTGDAISTLPFGRRDK